MLVCGFCVPVIIEIVYNRYLMVIEILRKFPLSCVQVTGGGGANVDGAWLEYPGAANAGGPGPRLQRNV